MRKNARQKVPLRIGTGLHITPLTEHVRKRARKHGYMHMTMRAHITECA